MNRLKNLMKYISATALISLFMISVMPQYASANNSEAHKLSSEAAKLLAKVRQATLQYRDEAAALAAGYVLPEGEPCVPGMGYHYVNFGLAGTPGVAELQPEILLYVDSPNGGRRLVGVEYLDFAITHEEGAEGPGLWFGEEEAASWETSNPLLFDGQVFNGPMEGHAPGMPWHYDLHVWVWSGNPDGTFATFNPNITCE